MATQQAIAIPVLEYEVAGLRLRYDGWRDEISGRIRDEHSNRKEMRFYDFAVKWQNGKGEVKTFSIAAKHIHPNHFRKGTASDNRKDIKVRVLNVAEIWRRRKLKEQEALREAIRNSNVTRFEISPYLERWLGPHAVFYVPDVLLFEPAQCGRDCRKGWIEAILVGHVTAEVARFIAQLYFDNGPYEAAVEAARVGKSLSELERCFAREEE